MFLLIDLIFLHSMFFFINYKLFKTSRFMQKKIFKKIGKMAWKSQLCDGIFLNCGHFDQQETYEITSFIILSC